MTASDREQGGQVNNNSRNLDQMSLEDQVTALKALNSQLQQERDREALSNSTKAIRLYALESVLIEHCELGQFTTFGRSSSADDTSQPLDERLVHEVMRSLESCTLQITRLIFHNYGGVAFFSAEDLPVTLHRFYPEVEENQIEAAVHDDNDESNKENLLIAIIILLVKRLVFDTHQARDTLLGEYQNCIFQRGSS